MAWIRPVLVVLSMNLFSSDGTYYGKDQFKGLLPMVDVTPGQVRLRAWAL